MASCMFNADNDFHRKSFGVVSYGLILKLSRLDSGSGSVDCAESCVVICKGDNKKWK